MDVEEESSTPIKNTSRPNEYLSIVPWRDPEQFIEVYKCLYNPLPNVTDKRWALDQITTWRTRCHPSLPSAIEVTAALIEAVVQDMLYNIERTVCTENNIQSLYCVGIMRFVNLTLETDNKEKLTVLARKHNIPSWIVDLRHDTSHAHPPSLPMLRMGTTIALRHLDETFWKEMAANVRSIVKTPSGVEENVIDVISKFKQVQFCIKEETGDYSELEKDLHELIEKIHSLVKKYNQKFVTAFVKPGVFLSAEEIVRLLKVDGDVLFLEEEENLTLPDVMQKFWLAVFRILHSSELISYFLEMLLLSLETCRNSLVQKTAISWAIFLFTAAKPGAPRSMLSQRFKAKGVQLNLKRLLYASMKGVNKFTLPLFMLIVSELGDTKKYEQLYYLVAMQLGLCLSKDKPAAKLKKDAMVFTVEDLENDFLEVKMQQQRKKLNNIWSLAPVNMNFANMPLGEIVYPKGWVPNREESSSEEEEEVDMDESDEESFIMFDENDKEPTVEVKSTPDNILLETEMGDSTPDDILLETEIGDMIYSK